MPNPFYQCYAAAALAAGAEPLYVPALKENGFLPDFAGLPEATLERLAAVYICSPSNPEGAVADETYWQTLFALADRHDFIVLADECYADIWFDRPPGCALPARLSPVRRLLAPAELPFPVQALRPAGPALGHGGGRRRPDREIPRLPQCRGSHRAHAAFWPPSPPPGATRTMSRPTAPPISEKMAAAERILGNRMTAAGRRLLPLAGGRQWRGIRASRLARTGGPGAARRLYGPGNCSQEKPSQTLAFPMSGWRLLTTYQPL